MLADHPEYGSQLINPATGAVLVQFDANEEETHARSAESAQHPREVGVAASDMHQPRQRKLTVLGVVSNTSLVTGTPQVRDRARLVFGVLDQLTVSGQLLRITTSLGEYEDMALVDYRVVRRHETRHQLVISLSFEQKATVTSELVQVPDDVLAVVLRASGRTRKSKAVVGRPETAKEKTARRKSVALKIRRRAGG